MSQGHVYVVIRLDTFHFERDRSDETIETAITLTKAYETEEGAEREAARLNGMNARVGARYFWRVARLQPASDSS